MTKGHDGHKGLDSHDGCNNYNGHNSSDGHDCHNKVFAPGQAGNGSVLPEDFLGAPGDVIPHFWLCKHTVCRELVWRTYTAAEALPMTKRVEFFSVKKFAKVALWAYDEAL